MMETLDHLKELTINLPIVPKLSDIMVSENIDKRRGDIYKLPGGTCIIYKAIDQSEVYVARTFVSEGTEFPEHLHAEKEHIIVYEGSIEIEIGEETIIMKAGDGKMFNIREPHSAKALEDSWFLVINIPRSKDYIDES